MDETRRSNVYDLLKRGIKIVESGGELPTEWARELFPPERREYELLYQGKESEEQILADTMAVPLQPVSTFGESDSGWSNKIIFGDNVQAMKTLLQMKQDGELVNSDGTSGVRLIYIDPPFATKRDFRGSQDQKAYQDKIAGAEFLEFLRKRLILLRELLTEDGSIYVHLDGKKAHYMKVLMDEVFGESHFRNEIIWEYKRWSTESSALPRLHDSIFWYKKGTSCTFNPPVVPNTNPNPSQYVSSKDSSGKTVVLRDKDGKPIKRETSENISIGDVWLIPIISPVSEERSGYPTQKPEKLLLRLIEMASNKGDLVLDAFAGSGTTCVVAEKLGRRWIGIDCGKLAVYTMQKRMLNLREKIGKSERKIEPKPFTLYNAGLYDFETLRQLPWKEWRKVALKLFECKDEPHVIRGFKLDGKRQGSSVYVYNHFEDGQISYDTIKDIHANVGKQIDSKFYIVAPRGAFLFQEDYIELDGVRYYALRIPYSYINELHRREFSALAQPSDETDVNNIVEAVGFDFINPPSVELEIERTAQVLRIKIKSFKTRARIKGTEKTGKHDTFSMVMADYDYKENVFGFDNVFFADELKKDGWKLEITTEKIGERVMFVFIDIYGNESRVVVDGREIVKTKRGSKKAVKK
ncbi:MAG: site-specific DNA-methyltransferase [Patescibacteria group bacterium]